MAQTTEGQHVHFGLFRLCTNLLCLTKPKKQLRCKVVIAFNVNTWVLDLDKLLCGSGSYCHFFGNEIVNPNSLYGNESHD